MPKVLQSRLKRFVAAILVESQLQTIVLKSFCDNRLRDHSVRRWVEFGDGSLRVPDSIVGQHRADTDWQPSFIIVRCQTQEKNLIASFL
ncbi:hypothetical protein J6590_096935 [Homalodisca vitripennis]|nr:hypothetical protein J6590_096935 [Homalodisca vitripennis]